MIIVGIWRVLSSLRRQGSRIKITNREYIMMRDAKNYYVYIEASKRNGTLYTGFTGTLSRRNQEHKNEFFESFTKKYHVHILVYYEVYDDVHAAIHREKCIKKWKREWKIKLIEAKNPTWRDLSDEIETW